MELIGCSHVSLSRGGKEVLRDVDLSVEKGELFGLLGPNGAGKSSLFDLLTTIRKPSSGLIRLFGVDTAADKRDVRTRIGAVFQNATLDDRLNAVETLYFHGMLHGLDKRILMTKIHEGLDWAGLAEQRSLPVRALSGGMRRRLELARALLHHPKLLLLDEPTIGLDATARASVWSRLARLRGEGLTVFLTTHQFAEAEACDRLAIIISGRIAAVDRPAMLGHRLGNGSLERAYMALTDGQSVTCGPTSMPAGSA